LRLEQAFEELAAFLEQQLRKLIPLRHGRPEVRETRLRAHRFERDARSTKQALAFACVALALQRKQPSREARGRMFARCERGEIPVGPRVVDDVLDEERRRVADLAAWLRAQPAQDLRAPAGAPDDPDAHADESRLSPLYVWCVA
jgi:hypothetical protein